MKVYVNGQPRDIAIDYCVLDLLRELQLEGGQVAVEINRRIIARSDWRGTALKEGARIEVVHFVGGGSEP